MPQIALPFAGVLLLLGQYATDALATEAPKRVLILDSFGRRAVPSALVVSALRAELTRAWPGPVDVYEQSLEATRASDPETETALADFLVNRLRNHPVDLVITVGAPAAQFVVNHRKRAFDTVPILAINFAVRNISADIRAEGIATIGLRPDLPGLISGILDVLPDTKHIYVVVGSSRTETFWKEAARVAFAPFEDRVLIEWWDGLSLVEMKSRIGSLPSNSAVLFSLVMRDAAGVAVDHDEALAALHRATNSPIFGIYESELGSGVVGGRLMQDRSAGSRAATLAVRILQGEEPSQLSAPPMGAMAPAFDWRELQRWGIPESRLPIDSNVLFRPPSLWEGYRWHLVGIASLVTLQSLLITGLLVQRVRRARAEKALAANEHRVHLITNSLPVLIAYVDRNQRYAFLNFAFQRWFDADAAMVRGRDMWAVLGERMYQSVRPYVERALAGEQVSFAVDTMLDNGRQLAVEGLHVPDLDESGEVQGFYSLMMDITARNQARREADELRAELLHAGRVSMMGVLAASLAHELNQPLTAILSNAQAARRFLANPSPNLQEVAEILDDIALDDERASEVIRRLRALVKKSPADFQSLEVAEMIRGVERMVRHDAMIRQVHVSSDVEPQLLRVRGDRVQLQQVLLNLIINAFEALQGSDEVDRRVTIGARLENGQVVIEVRDHGTGIRQEIHDRLFEPFHSSKQQGLGMGLSISKSIVELHAGRLWAENNPDRGATFYLSLPVDRTAADVEATTEDMQHGKAIADGIHS